MNSDSSTFSDSDARPRGYLLVRVGIISVFILGSLFLTYIALTHTEVGRDYLRQELEDRFAESFSGHIEIASISSNPLQRIHLQDISFYDEHENLWLHIHQITAQPKWEAMLGAKIQFASLNIIGPSLTVEYRSDSTWNLSSVLSRRQSTSTQNWEFESTSISVSDGKISMSNQEHAPVRSGRLLDMLKSSIYDISLEGQLNLQTQRRLFTIESFNAVIDTLHFEANGELLHEGNLFHINALDISNSLNHASIVGVLSITDKFADLSLLDSYVSREFANVIFPEVPLPNSLSLKGNIHQNEDRWSISDYTITTDVSRIEIASAKFETTEDHNSFEAHIKSSTLNPVDLQPLLNISRWRGGNLQVNGHVQGNATIDMLDLSGTLKFLTQSGSSAHLEASAVRNQTWRYDANLTTSNLNLYDLTAQKSLQGRIDGSLNLSGEGIRSPSLFASLILSSSEIGGRIPDSLSLEANLHQQQLHLRSFLADQKSHISAELTADWATNKPSYQTTGVLSFVDLGSLLDIPALQTRLHGNWEMSGVGSNLDDLIVDLQMKTDSSLIIWNETQQSISPTHWSINLLDTTATDHRLAIVSDVVDFQISGNIVQRSIELFSPIWSNALENTFDRFANQFNSIDINQASKEDLTDLPKEKRESIPLISPPIDIDLTWQLHEHSAIDALMLFLPSFHSHSNGVVALKMDDELFQVKSEFQDELFKISNVSIHQAKGSLTMDASLSENIESNWEIGLTLSADSIESQRITTQSPSISLKQKGDSGTLELRTGIGNSSVQGSLSSQIHVLADRLRLEIQNLRIPIGDDLWTISEKTAIELQASSTVINPLQLVAINPLLEEIQSVTIQGKLSQQPEDTVKVNLNGVDLNHISNTLELRRSLGGQVDADLLWTGLWQPEITGTLEVDTLVFSNRIIGHIRASSILLPGSPELKLSMVIDSIATPSTSYIPLTNQAELIGNIIVGDQDRQGELDLYWNIQHFDVALLKVFFRELVDFDGEFVGQFTLQGSRNNLAFDGSLDWRNGGFSIPRYNSSFDATGKVHLSGDQIVFDQVLVQDGLGGSAGLEGTLNFNDFRYISFDATSQLESLQVMNVLSHRSDLPFYGDIRISGDATLTGPIYSSFLRSDNLIVTPQSDLYIPVRELDTAFDPGFIIFADSTQSIENQFATMTRTRKTILGRRPEGERTFRDGLDIDLNLVGPPGSNIRLVIDPLLGDVINAIGTARVQIQRTEGEMSTYGSFMISSGDYLFTAGEIFVRRFLIDSGTITWNGAPLNPTLNISGAYQTRASRSGLPDDVGGAIQTSLPLIVNLDVSGTLNAILVDLNLEVDQRQEAISDTPLLDSYLNRPDLATEHATSVLLTNSFLLSANTARGGVFASSAVNSVSSLVANQLNRYLSQVIPQADFRIGVQSDETIQDLDVSAGIALRLLNERLVIRGQGVYRGLNAEEVSAQGLQGEFIVEIQLNPSVSIEFFYRREGDVLSESLITSEAGVGLNYRTEFTSWRQLFKRNLSNHVDSSEDAME